MKRRSFLKRTSLASASILIPGFLNKVFAGRIRGFNGNRLIVIQLAGGNDGLNCVIPFRNDAYYASRPDISVYGSNLINISDNAALNLQLKGLADLHDEGGLGIFNSVGYPNPNRSHFRSTDIWQTASGSDEYLPSGWIGRVLDSNCNNTCLKPFAAVEINDYLSLALKGNNRKGIAFRNISSLRSSVNSSGIREMADESNLPASNAGLEYLRKTLTETVQSVDYLSGHLSTNFSGSTYPDHEFGKQLKLIAGLIAGGCESLVYYVSLPGFDTHAIQKGIQNRLLKIYGDSIRAFCKDLKSLGEFDNTLMLSFSEFGRRVAQNGSKGTDHGAANVVFLAGGGLRKKGIINGLPDLENLEDGDIRFTVDFRSIYATLIEKWLAIPSWGIIAPQQPILDFI